MLDAHLHDLRVVLHSKPDIIESYVPPLINFEKWAHLKELAMDPLRYRGAFLLKLSTYTQQTGVHSRDNRRQLERVVAYLDKILQCDDMAGDNYSMLFHTNVKAKQKGSDPITNRKDAEKVLGFGTRRSKR